MPAVALLTLEEGRAPQVEHVELLPPRG
jgi:hypothetical protein